jgi:hypothetical protein
MSDSPDKLSQCWQEFNSPRIIKVISVYASVTLILIGSALNLVELFSLPNRTPTLVLENYTIGLPIAIIFSWNINANPEGKKKTDSFTTANKQVVDLS